MRAKRTAGLAFLVLLTACLLAACGRSGEATGSKEASGEHTIDLGSGRQVTVDKGAKANIAFFIATTSNLYTQAMVDEAEKTAAKLGAGLTVFDGKFDATTQFNQMQSALQRHEFNAWWVSPIDGNQSCSMLSETAPEQGIVVGISDIVLCDRGERPADEVWQPGTLDYVGAETTTNFIDAWVEQIAARLPGAHEIGVLEGPPLTNLTDNIEGALEKLEKRRPDLHVVASENTDFTTPDGLAKAQTMLHAHPGIDVVISSYADVTVGAIKAIKAAGKPVQVFDLGGSAAEVPLIKDGSLTASAAYSPRGHARAVVKALVGAVLEGKKPPTFDPGLDYGSTDKPYMVEKSNVDSYLPQY